MKIIGKYKQSSKFSKFALFFSLQIFPSIVLAAHHGLLNNEGALQQISIKNSGSADSEYLVVPMNTSPGATISLQIGIEGIPPLPRVTPPVQAPPWMIRELFAGSS